MEAVDEIKMNSKKYSMDNSPKPLTLYGTNENERWFTICGQCNIR